MDLEYQYPIKGLNTLPTHEYVALINDRIRSILSKGPNYSCSELGNSGVVHRYRNVCATVVPSGHEVYVRVWLHGDTKHREVYLDVNAAINALYELVDLVTKEGNL